MPAFLVYFMYYIALVVVAAAVMEFLLLPIYIRLKNNKKYAPAKMAVKASMTFIAFALALHGILKLWTETRDINNLVTGTGMKTSILLPVGLFVCMVADVVLCVSFKYGMLLFLCGHICYIAYFIVIGGFSLLSLPFLVAGVAGMSLYFGRYTRKEGRMFFLYTIYGAVIMITLSTGIVLPVRLHEYGVLPALASVMLVVSDIMLGLNRLRKTRRIADLMYLGYYFTGQFFLGLSVFAPVMLGI